MSLIKHLLPGSLFGRVLLVLLLTFGSFALVTVAAVIHYALYPVVQRSTADLAAFMELSANTLVRLQPDMREDYRARVRKLYQVALHDPDDAPRELQETWFPYALRLGEALSQRYSHPVTLHTNLVDGERWYWARLDTVQGAVWGGFPRNRIQTHPAAGLLALLLAAVALVLVTAAALARSVTRPLVRLSRAAEEVARGRSPTPLPETGPRELADLARQFNHTSREIREILATRTMMLVGISHDLRTPLTRLRLALEMIGEPPDPKLLARMQADIEEMNAMITQTVEIGGSMGAGKRTLTELHLLIGEVVGNRARIIWRNRNRCSARIDRLALRRILGNLLENALRYSSEQVEVRLDCGSGGRTIFVLDRGPGIPADQREAVFRPFYRLEASRSRSTGGSGLGLAVVRQLAVSNGIEVHLSGRRGGGTVAAVRLPPEAEPKR